MVAPVSTVTPFPSGYLLRRGVTNGDHKGSEMPLLSLKLAITLSNHDAKSLGLYLVNLSYGWTVLLVDARQASPRN